MFILVGLSSHKNRYNYQYPGVRLPLKGQKHILDSSIYIGLIYYWILSFNRPDEPIGSEYSSSISSGVVIHLGAEQIDK